MKRSQLSRIALFSFIMVSGSVISQGITTPTNPNVINCTQQSDGDNQFEVVPLTPSQSGAYFSYLWWSGDNDFSFVDTPHHIHGDTKGNPDFPKVKMSVVPTENYGSGGPPPLTSTFTTSVGNRIQRTVLPQGTDIYMQNYRNAVIGDVMYLIVSYGNSTNRAINGKLKFNTGNHARVSNSMLSAHPHFLSNGESWDVNRNECTFQNLGAGEERSILIPVDILQNDKDELNIRVDLLKGTSDENANVPAIDYYMIRPAVANSHDPNQMIQHSTAKNECNYRNGKIHYTVKFQNEGTGPTSYVRVECQLDDKVNLNEISGIQFPNFYSAHTTNGAAGQLSSGAGAIFNIDRVNRVVTFEMHDLKLESINDPNLTNLELARDQIEFDILVKGNYVFGPATIAQSNIYFDQNSPIETNEVQTVCGDPLPESRGGGFQKVEDIRIEKKKEVKQLKRN